jgi:hypothetical protein
MWLTPPIPCRGQRKERLMTLGKALKRGILTKELVYAWTGGKAERKWKELEPVADADTRHSRNALFVWAFLLLAASVPLLLSSFMLIPCFYIGMMALALASLLGIIGSADADAYAKSSKFDKKLVTDTEILHQKLEDKSLGKPIGDLRDMVFEHSLLFAIEITAMAAALSDESLSLAIRAKAGGRREKMKREFNTFLEISDRFGLVVTPKGQFFERAEAVIKSYGVPEGGNTVIPAAARFCPRCGNPLRTEPVEPVSAEGTQAAKLAQLAAQVDDSPPTSVDRVV